MQKDRELTQDSESKVNIINESKRREQTLEEDILKMPNVCQVKGRKSNTDCSLINSIHFRGRNVMKEEFRHGKIKNKDRSIKRHWQLSWRVTGGPVKLR